MNSRRMIRCLTVQCLAAGLLATMAVAAPPRVNGKLDSIETLRVLRVWGTAREMGYAHGYLLGAEFLEYLSESLSGLEADAIAERETAQARLVDVIDLPTGARAEIEGIFEGIKARLGAAPKIPALDRRLSLDDLIMHNGGDLIRAFGCSGFTVWDTSAGGGGVITARNFDFPVPGPKTMKQQFILVRNPTGGRKVATVTFPGYIGVFTGVNDDGVCAFLHDGNGRSITRPGKPVTPVALVLAELLERTSRRDAHSYAEVALTKVAPYPFSYLIRVVTPSPADASKKPARVFRLDASGLGENAVEQTWCLTTNHYVAEDSIPVGRAGADSLRRFKLLRPRMNLPMTRERTWESLEVVASSNPAFPTLHSLVVYPDQRRLELAMAMWTDRIIPAPNIPPTSISFLQLFSPRD